MRILNEEEKKCSYTGMFLKAWCVFNSYRHFILIAVEKKHHYFPMKEYRKYYGTHSFPYVAICGVFLN